MSNVTLEIESELKDRLEQAAELDRRPLKNLMVCVLADWVDGKLFKVTAKAPTPEADDTPKKRGPQVKDDALTCQQCGKPFMGRKSQKFCSAECGRANATAKENTEAKADRASIKVVALDGKRKNAAVA